MTAAYQRFIEALQAHGCRGRGSSWQCPAHADNVPSLSVRDGGDRALVYCHAKCNPEEIVAAVGLELRDLFDDPPEGPLSYQVGCIEPKPSDATAAPSTLIDFSEIIAKPVRWAWRDRIALAKLTALAGRPKIGKGIHYSHLIAAVTRGDLDGDLGEPRNVVLVTTEDDPGDTLKPRLMAADADLARVAMFQMGSREEPVPFRVPQDADELGRRVAEKDAALVVIDPLIEFLDRKTDTHKSQPVRQAIAALNGIAREQGCAILVVIHLNKGASTDPLMRHEAAAAFTQIVRGGLLLGFDPDDPDGEGDQRVLAVSASNLARLAPSLVYRIDTAHVIGDSGEEIETARMEQIGESAAASHDLLRGLEGEESRADYDEATEFLLGELAEGPKSAGEIKRAAGQVGVGPGALKRAKRELRVVSTKGGMQGGWTWSLAEGDDPKGTDHVPEKPSPSSPSAFQAENGTPERDVFTEGDVGKGHVPFATPQQEAEVERLRQKGLLPE